MPREYPRFLYSNPQNTKSEGPFVVHCFPPQLLCKISVHEGKVKAELVEVWNKTFKASILGIVRDAQKWAQAQVNEGVIKL